MDARRARRPKSIHDPAYMGLCKSLKELREQASLTQRELAERMDEHRSFVWKVEAGERRLDAVEMVRWCLACDADPLKQFKALAKGIKTPKRRA